MRLANQANSVQTPLHASAALLASIKMLRRAPNAHPAYRVRFQWKVNLYATYAHLGSFSHILVQLHARSARWVGLVYKMELSARDANLGHIIPLCKGLATLALAANLRLTMEQPAAKHAAMECIPLWAVLLVINAVTCHHYDFEHCLKLLVFGSCNQAPASTRMAVANVPHAQLAICSQSLARRVVFWMHQNPHPHLHPLQQSRRVAHISHVDSRYLHNYLYHHVLGALIHTVIVAM